MDRTTLASVIWALGLVVVGLNAAMIAWVWTRPAPPAAVQVAFPGR